MKDMEKNKIHINCQIKNFDKTLVEMMKIAVITTLARFNEKEHYSLSILICDDDKIKTLNATYRGISSPTDVLSFPTYERLPGTDELYLGDIAISFPTTIRQARENQHPVSQELSLLCIHGVLHLLGYDHETQEEESKMWALQNEILTSLGMSTHVSGGLRA